MPSIGANLNKFIHKKSTLYENKFIANNIKSYQILQIFGIFNIPTHLCNTMYVMCKVICHIYALDKVAHGDFCGVAMLLQIFTTHTIS